MSNDYITASSSLRQYFLQPHMWTVQRREYITPFRIVLCGTRSVMYHHLENQTTEHGLWRIN